MPVTPAMGPRAPATAAECLPDDATPEQIARVTRMEAQLQALLDEQAAGVSELIERTVALHRQIKTEVAQMLEQDKEEEALVREVCIRTEQAEKDLMRNPNYQAFKEQHEAGGGVTTAQRVADWPMDATLLPHAAWQEHVRLGPEEAAALLQACRGRPSPPAAGAIAKMVRMLQRQKQLVYLKVYGTPLHDLRASTGKDARLVLGMAGGLIKRARVDGDKSAVTADEVRHVHKWLQCIHAHLDPADGAEAVSEALLGSAQLRRHLTVAATQTEPLYIVAAPLAGLLRAVPLRVLVVRGELRAVEQRHSQLVHSALGAPDWAGRAAVEAFAASVLCPAPSLKGKSFAADLIVDDPTGAHPAVGLDWLRPLGADSSRSFEWQEVCAFSTAPAGGPATWRLRQTAPPDGPEGDCDEDDGKNSAVWVSLLHEERKQLRPGHCVWEGTAPDGVLAAVAAPARQAAQGGTPPAAARGAPQQPPPAPLPVSTPALCTAAAAFAAASFGVGYIAARR
eukprot:TRINITY_DN50052_c0_g1_i1.p1 TRINITY_DN50052_c0_g1~~TRINITY_DN50052_c0_g1_i1.p1  ORF type:complete len:533 (+),score=197.44 TRINITY_DN50052_c0_g1_i1:75-1601(+)